jgi:hypothetical protein
VFLLIRKLNFPIKCSEIEGGRGNRGIPIYQQGKTVIATCYQMSILISVYKQYCLHQSRLARLGSIKRDLLAMTKKSKENKDKMQRSHTI